MTTAEYLRKPSDPLSDRLVISDLFENHKKLVEALYNRFSDDFELWELKALERGAELTGKKGIEVTVNERIKREYNQTL